MTTMTDSELVAVKVDIAAGLTDLAVGRVKEFDTQIVERARKPAAEGLPRGDAPSG